MKRQEDPTIMEDLKKYLNALFWIGMLLAYPLEVWCRKPGTVGEKHFSPISLAGLALFLVIGVFASPFHHDFLLWFCGMTLLWTFGHRMARHDLNKKGFHTHSQYTGISHFDKPGRSEFDTKQQVEPFVAIAVGILAWCIGLECLAVPVFASAIGSAVFVEYDRLRWAAMNRTMRDKLIEQEMLREQLEEVRKK